MILKEDISNAWEAGVLPLNYSRPAEQTKLQLMHVTHMGESFAT
jgi:hypothetical protein